MNELSRLIINPLKDDAKEYVSNGWYFSNPSQYYGVVNVLNKKWESFLVQSYYRLNADDEWKFRTSCGASR